MNFTPPRFDKVYFHGMAIMNDDTYRCQFCEKESPAKDWGIDGDICPLCGRSYDAIAAQDSEE